MCYNQFSFLTSSSYWVALTTSFFTTSFKSTGAGTNLSTSTLSTLFFKPVGTFSNLSTSNISTSDFKFATSVFLGNVNVSTLVPYLKSAFVA